MIKTPSNVFALNCNGNFNDESGNGYNCTGTATLADSQFGQCASFNGSQYLSTQNNVDLSSTDKLTICFWIKFTGTTLQIISEQSANFNLNNAFMIDISDAGGAGAIQFADRNYPYRSGNTDYNISYTSKKYNDGNWHFVTITSDRTQNALNQTSIYVDLIKDTVLHPTFRADLSGNYSSLPLFLGSRNNSQYFFNGQLTRFKIYKKILSFEDIKRIYEGFSPLNG